MFPQERHRSCKDVSKYLCYCEAPQAQESYSGGKEPCLYVLGWVQAPFPLLVQKTGAVFSKWGEMNKCFSKTSFEMVSASRAIKEVASRVPVNPGSSAR